MQATGAPGDWIEDWITIWESELACLACDVELREGLLAAAGLWAAQAREAGAWQALVPYGDAPQAGPARTRPQAGAAAAAAAPDAGLAAEAGLAGVVAALERRLAALEGAGTAPGT